jgi:Cytochrome c554 and c-prime
MMFRTRIANQCALAIAVATAACWFGQLGKSADAPDAAPSCPGGGNPKSQFKGANYCSGCHSPSSDNKLPRDWVALREFPTWDQHDKHRHAYEALTCPRAKQMEVLLRMPKDKPATKDERCLACHSLDLGHGDSGNLLGEEGSPRREAALAQGVSCEACHGASSEWFGPHSEPTLWRDKVTERMEGRHYDDYGMTHLRDPVKRTELCLSCHLGNIECGKFVTHEMYAAGHPPLPAFEVETFLERMPRHWQLDSERKAAADAETDPTKRADIEQILKQNSYQPFARSRAALLEGLVTLRASIKLLADQTEPSRAANADENHPYLGLAEFALYDCAACHHELTIPSARQERGYFGTAPGRPPLKYWSLPLARLGLNREPTAAGQSSSAALDTMLAPLHSAIRSRPFGDPQLVRKAAGDALALLRPAIAALEKRSLDSNQTLQLIQQLCEFGEKSPLDFDSARLVAGALDVLVAELKQQRAIAPPVGAAVDELKHLVHLDDPPASFSCDPDKSPTASDGNAEFNSFQFGEKLKALAAAVVPQ